MHKIVLFGAFPRAKNRALDRAFWCSPSCKKSCFLMLSLVPRIVLFGAFPHVKDRARDRAFWQTPSRKKSCFLVLAFVHCSPLSRHRALDCVFLFSSCTKSCFLLLSFVLKIVLFGALPRAKNRAFWCFPLPKKSCFLVLSLVPKSCSRSCFLVPSFVPKIVL